MTDYRDIRHKLHSHPQTAGNEQYAHEEVLRHLQQLNPSKIYTHVGGYGVVAVWDNGGADGPTVAFRADTDALPMGHRCGHDGHTTVLMRVAELIDAAQASLPCNCMLIWQPAEETGEGAVAVLESGVLQQYNIVAVYGMHNIPGYPMGEVVLCPHTFAAASAGVIYRLEGRETHASTPELGLNPGLAVAEIIGHFDGFNTSASPFRQSTLVCVRIGSPAFGTSAGQAEVMFTLRAFTNEVMQQLLNDANRVVDEVAARHGLSVNRMLQEPFHATENCVECVEKVERVASQAGLSVHYREQPFRWSEDFAEYLLRYRGVMFGMGSGLDQPELHHPDYDFPDELIETAAQMITRLLTAQ